MSIFGMRLLAGEVTADKYARFNSIRDDLRKYNEKYDKYFKNKQMAVRSFVDIFITYNPDYMKLIDRLEASNEKRTS